jgi:hypothetical protein
MIKHEFSKYKRATKKQRAKRPLEVKSSNKAVSPYKNIKYNIAVQPVRALKIKK